MAASAGGGKVKMPCARALYSFQGQATHELDFNAGVSIMLLRRVDENWLEGKLDGKVGIFPATHVKIEVGSPSCELAIGVPSALDPSPILLQCLMRMLWPDLASLMQWPSTPSKELSLVTCPSPKETS